MDSAPQLFEPREAYFRHPAMSASTATALLSESPAQVRYDLDNPSEPTRAMDFGRMAHQSVLEGLDLEEAYFVVPDDFTPSHHKKWSSLIEEIEASGKPTLKERDLAQVRAMREALLSCDLARMLFSTGTSEAPHYWRCPVTEVECKALFDYRPDGSIFGDYKTVHSLDRDSIARAIASLHWAHRAWWYMDGIKDLTGNTSPQYVFVCQDKRPPHLVRLIVLHSEQVRQAGYEMLAKRQEWAQCRETGVYPSWGEVNGMIEVETVGLPAWESKRLEASAEEIKAYIEFHRPVTADG